MSNYEPLVVERPIQAFQQPAPVRLHAQDVHKRYRKGHVEIPVLRGVDLDVRRGEFLSIIGQSGSGKSTLLHLLGTLDRPDSGSVHLDQRRIEEHYHGPGGGPQAQPAYGRADRL